MKRVVAAILFFMLYAALCAALAWTGGYNFDHRSPDVAVGIVLGALWSGLLTRMSLHLLTNQGLL